MFGWIPSRRHRGATAACAAAVLLAGSFGSERGAAQSVIERLADGRIRPSGTPGLRVAYLPIVLPSAHAANVLQLRNGELLCTYYAGVWEGRPGVAIVLARLARGSSQWTPPVVVAQAAGRALENPVLFEAPGGTLWLFYTTQSGDAGQADAEILAQTSADAGRTWGKPRALVAHAGSFDRQRLVVAGDAWLFPVYFTPGMDASDTSAVEITRDQGRTWKECAIPGSNGLVQPDAIELAAHRFVAFFRSRYADWVYSSRSEDGCTWTKPEATEIPNNNSSIQVARLRDGHLVMAFNNIQAGTMRSKARSAARWPLSVALSTDGGKTWPWVRDVDIGAGVPQETVPQTMAGMDVREEMQDFLEHRIEYSYPSIVAMDDGTIAMEYTYRRRTIKYVAFDEGWIKQGTTLGYFTGDRQ
ncbi:MAG: sialidase family protein [Acidobacteriaceae bacterium]